MAPPTNRKDILDALRGQVAAGRPIIGAGAGIGLSAKFIEAGRGDLIIIYNSGRFRMAGRGSLAGLMPYGNANDIVLEMVCNLPNISTFPTSSILAPDFHPSS
jgi:predicted TIM-barrel enzyme